MNWLLTNERFEHYLDEMVLKIQNDTTTTSTTTIATTTTTTATTAANNNNSNNNKSRFRCFFIKMCFIL